jgi:hypothetical protein
VRCAQAGRKCSGEVTTWGIYRNGEPCGQIHFCDVHAAPLMSLLDKAEPIPVKERSVMKVTKLRVTPATAKFKK